MLKASPKRLADAVKVKSALLRKEGSLSFYKVPLKEEKLNIKECKHFSYGKEPKRVKSNRTIMVLGATGAGKSTLINGMINYILGVKWEDSYRFQIVDDGVAKSQAESQTSEVTVYQIYHEEGFAIDCSLTIVDTPGFGDTRGIDRDREITEQLRSLFSAENGVSVVDAVCFVAQAALARLTPSQRYVFDSMLSIFGKDVAENICILVTFADGQRPLVLEAINAAEIPCPKENGLPLHFKFNNSALFADNKSSADEDEDGGFDKMFWNMGSRSMKRFFVALNFIETKSLTLTKDVLRERKQLENSIENLHKKYKLGLAKLEQIRETTEILNTHEAEINRNRNLVLETTVNKLFAVDISGTGVFVTNCQRCHFTCHYNCKRNDKDKKRCRAMGRDGKCTQCAGKCPWNVHFNQKYKWEYRQVQEKTTIDELKKKYQVAVDVKSPVKDLIGKLNADEARVQEEVTELIKMSAQSLNRLTAIALKPNPLSTPDYINMLIQGEKDSAEPGWQKRVESLTTMRQKAELMAKVGRGEKP